MVTPTPDELWRALGEIADPEIPVVSLVEMGIVRDVRIQNGGVVVTMTPTFAGCPALQVMRETIEEKMRELGAAHVEVKIALTPRWSSDWITDAARAKLKAFGLAPPPKHGGNVQLFFPDEIVCPYCNSTDTSVTNNFGSTLCRAIYFCRNCRQPFEQFKAL